jgi:hypothetical protein
MVFVEPAHDDAPVVSVRRGAGLIWIMGVIMGAMLVGGAVLVLNYLDMRAQAGEALAQKSADAAMIANLQRDKADLVRERELWLADKAKLETEKTNLQNQLATAQRRARPRQEQFPPPPRQE